MIDAGTTTQWISGVRITDLIQGTGRDVTLGTRALANVRMFLRKGDELADMDTCGQNIIISLDKRRKSPDKHKCIPGLRYGVIGMREQGVRQLIISPHLAFGSDGFPNRVPPNAVIHCSVELLKVTDIEYDCDAKSMSSGALIRNQGPIDGDRFKLIDLAGN